MIKEDVSKRDELAEERTLLATERTFSAWIRTGLAGLAGGLAFLRLITFKTMSHQILGHVIGITLTLWGGALFIFAALDYHRSCQKLMVAKKYKKSWIELPIIIIPLMITTILLLVIYGFSLKNIVYV